MGFREVLLPDDVTGRLVLHSMPGRCEPWATFLANARREGVTDVLCLALLGEVAEKAPDYAQVLASPDELPFALQLLGIPDYGLPGDAAAFGAGIETIAARLRAGGVVLVHCGAGIGRTGTAATCILIQLGVSHGDSSEAVREAGSGPETRDQREFVGTFRPRA